MDMEKSRQQLIGRLTENYADYRAELLLKDRQELIDGADRIAKTAEVIICGRMVSRSTSTNFCRPSQRENGPCAGKRVQLRNDSQLKISLRRYFGCPE